MILKRPVHIARKGRMIGEFSSSDLPGLLDRGEIHADDNCYLEETNDWVPVGDYIRATSLPNARIAVESDDPEPEPLKASGVFQPSTGSILPSVVLLFSLALIAAAGAWIFNLQSQLNSAMAQVAALQKEMLERPKASDPGKTAPHIPAERTKVAGSVEIQDEKGVKRPLPGFYVDLYEETKIRDYLMSRSLDLSAFKQSQDADIMARILSDMPVPLRKTTTDSAGHYEFQLPGEGRYVVYSSMSLNGPSGPEILLWFLSFATDDPLNLPVNITDENRAKRLEPEFLINPGRPATTSPQASH